MKCCHCMAVSLWSVVIVGLCYHGIVSLYGYGIIVRWFY